MSDFRDNEAMGQYELDHEGGPSYARYRDDQGVRAILYVETPAPVRGRGHADRLMAALVIDARAKGVKLTPICGYAAAYFSRHRDTADVLT